MKTLNLAVIGRDVSKSTSPQIHTFIAEHMGNRVSYNKISVSEEEFESRVESIFEELDGFNVTIPYKLSVIPHLNKIRGDAEAFGAVNTVRTRDKTGDNTDGLGFALMLKNNGVDVEGKEVLLLGAGGAGRSVAKKLADSGAAVSVYDRRTENAQSIAKEFKGVLALDEIKTKPYFAIVNATGVGMHRTEGISPVGEDILKLCGVAVDLIYTPRKSRFLEIAGQYSKKIINGEAMLFYQAYFSECIYFDLRPDENQAKLLFEKYTEENV